MEFNTDKCQVLRVSRKRDPLIHEYILHGKILESVDSAKYLGVSITSDLCWNQHISNIVTKGNQSLGFLRRNLRINSPELKSIAYKSRGTQRQFSENTCSEDDLRSILFGTFAVKFLACLPLLGFSKI